VLYVLMDKNLTFEHRGITHLEDLFHMGYDLLRNFYTGYLIDFLPISCLGEYKGL